MVVPAWEFPDIPNFQFDGNPQNNWVETANRCSLVLVGGPFTADALQAAGVITPIRIVPVPTPERYFRLHGWQSDFRGDAGLRRVCLRRRQSPGLFVQWPAEGRQRLTGTLRSFGFHAYRRLIQGSLPRRARTGPHVRPAGRHYVLRERSLPRHCGRGLDLGGIVYTSIFNPNDGRKNSEAWYRPSFMPCATATTPRWC